MLKVSEAASLAMHTMVLLARNPDAIMTTSQISAILNASDSHLSKVLQRLAKAGFVKSTRGPHGGFALNRRPEDVTLMDIYESIEGKLRPITCLLSKPVCDGNCILGGLLSEVNKQVMERFSKTTLPALGGRFEGHHGETPANHQD